MRQGVGHGPLPVPVGTRRPPVANVLNTRGRQPWHVPSRARYAYGPGVLGSLARYWRGGPIAHRRRRACDGPPVVCRSTERANGPGGQAQRRPRGLPLAPCIGRWRLHGPPVGAVVGRAWGLYATLT